MKEKLDHLKDKPGKSSIKFTIKLERRYWTGAEGLKLWNEFWKDQFKKHIDGKSSKI